ncbi:MAG TPA: von Willebrand factor type A domain-containing protein [Longimicrobium sp.]|jgi:Ca-activated chloride channel family protein|uniref:YfbK domain-containing protein n=1 Tax=Longimicrobium sp. TaxID=2029185 RepID=UPI002EDA5AE8
MATRFVSTLFALLLLLASQPGRAQAPAVVTGRVTHPQGQPEAGVLVRIQAYNLGAVTTTDGTYRLVVPAERIRTGTAVQLTASRVGLGAVTRSITLQPGATIVQNFTLAPQALSLDGIVVSGTAPQVSNREQLGDATWSGSTPAPGPPGRGYNTEEYNHIEENVFHTAARTPLSTFAVDVDRASYSNVRRFIRDGGAPPRDAVRIEEMVNYFSYAYPDPTGEHPFAVVTEVGAAPWNPRHQLVRIGLQGRRLPRAGVPPSNLVFLVDVSGSMDEPDKLPLVQQSLRLLVNELSARDRVAIVVYAGAAGLVLESTPGDRKDEILDAIERLQAGGSTAGAQGIRLAYEVARRNHIAGGNNRVILASDGDFNVGVSSQGELVQLIEEKRGQGTFLTVLGFGTGNLADTRMEQMADHGNGNYAYVDDLMEGRKVLVTEMGGTLFTIAKDVKLQVEFNPARVYAYRLIGYENRLLADEDFNDDRKDAGEIGAGHSVTALYEVVPVGADSEVRVGTVDSLRYQRTDAEPVGAFGSEMMNVKVRYKAPDGDHSRLLSHAVQVPARNGATSDDFRFAAAVAAFGMVLRESEHRGRATVQQVLTLARGARGGDAEGYRAEFIRMVEGYAHIRTAAAPTGDR